MKLKKDNTNKIKIGDLEVLVATLSAASRKRSEILLATNARGRCTHTRGGAWGYSCGSFSWKIKIQKCTFLQRIITPCWPLLDFWEINLQKSSRINWIFSLFQTGFLLTVQPAKINFKIDNCRLKIWLAKLDFSYLIFSKSSTDQQGNRFRNPLFGYL